MCDGLEMLVTGDPIAELDAALGCALARPGGPSAAVNLIVAERLVAWIDQGLDERLSLNGIASEWSDG